MNLEWANDFHATILDATSNCREPNTDVTLGWCRLAVIKDDEQRMNSSIGSAFKEKEANPGVC